MCVPKEHRSIAGTVTDQIYDYLQSSHFCDGLLENTFVDHIASKNGNLLRTLDGRRIMIAVETFLKDWKKEWQDKFVRYVLYDFHNFLNGIGALEKIPIQERYDVAKAWLYYYCGVACLDEARRLGKIK